MRNAVLALALTAAGPALAADGCFLDTPPEQRNAQQFETRMQAIALAMMPIEYRNSCSIRDAYDQRLYDAVKAKAGCMNSEGYDTVFGQYLQDDAQYVFAVNRVDLRTDEDFERYCKITQRIDLRDAVSDDGTMNTQALQLQSPLFFALQELVATRRWQK